VHPDLDSLALAEVLSLADKIASTPGAPLVIVGGPGAPLEALARYVHDQVSEAYGARWMPVRCRGVPDEVVEGEIGDIMDRGQGGTVFIDAVCDLSAVAQMRLMSLLAARVPDGRSPRRVIVGTNVELATAVRDGSLRAELFDKLAATTTIAMPPLRARAPDIERLACVYLRESATSLGKCVDGLSSEAIAKLRGYAFPGNERELRRIVGRGVVIETETTLRGDSIELGPSCSTSDEAFASEIAMAAVREHDRPATLAEMERAYIIWVISYTKGNRTAASRMLGISYPTIAKKISEYGIDLSSRAGGRRKAPK
jgi:DNA-binding NtrC family response regulator